MTKKCNRLRGERPKAFWGALVGGAMNLIGSAISSKSQARAIRRQIEAQKEAARTQLELANNSNLASTLNSYATATRSYNDEDDYNLKYRLGGNKRLGSNRIYITDGGDATKIDNDTYLLRGGSHEQTNETGQTGIGINVGGNEIEAEGGEVAQKKNGALRIFSAQPMLGGISPAQAVMSGASKDKVFNAQQQFKRRNHLSDGGGKAKHGTEVPYKRIHINEDGTFTDTLTGKNYNTSATNGEDVVITGKANHWKEAGKKNTSSYFDPMGAVNFITAAGAPILNANPSNIVGSIRDSKSASDFLKHYMMQDTGGFVNTKWAKEHPYLSLGINTIGDIGLGYGLGKTGVGLYRLRPSNLRKHIFENISPIGYDKPIPRIKEALKSALSGAEADIDNPSWFNRSNAYDLGTYNTASVSRFPEHALEARFDAWRKYLGLPQKFNTWTKSPIVKGAYTDEKGISKLKRLPLDQSIDFVNSAGGNVANEIEEFATRGARGQKYGVSHIRDTWDLQPWSRLKENIIEDKLIRPLYNNTIGKVNLKLSSSLNKFINKYGYDNEAIQKYLNETGEEGLDNLADVIELFADTKSMKGKLAHKLEGLDDILNDKSYYISDKHTKLSKLTNKLSNKIKNFEPSSLLPGAKPFKIAYDIPWTNEVFPNNEMIKGFNMIDNLPTEAYRYKLKNPLLNYKYHLGGRCKLRNGGLTSKDRGSSKHPYPSVSSKDFAGGGRSYPIPTKADAVDALRLAGLHGRSDVRSKVFSKYPSLRKKSSLGSYIPPVKGMRTKFAIGGKEDKGYDMTGELSPVISTAKWRTPRFATLGSVDTTARAIPNFSTIKIPTYIPSSTIPYKGQNINRSRTIFSGGDYLGLGIDALSALGTGLITSNAYKNLDFNYNLPNFVEESPVALNTTYHNEAQKSNVERNRLNSRNSILRNTMSGSTAVGRMQGVDTNALYQLNQLADTKENKETELMNQNLLNEQQVRARNAAARNQYYNTVATIKNAALEAKNNASLARSQAFSTSLSGLSQAWNNFWTAGRTAYEDDQARRAMIASSKDATPTKLIEMGYDLSPQIIAALYSTSTDQHTKDFYLSMLDEKQRRKYGIS